MCFPHLCIQSTLQGNKHPPRLHCRRLQKILFTSIVKKTMFLSYWSFGGINLIFLPEVFDEGARSHRLEATTILHSLNLNQNKLHRSCMFHDLIPLFIRNVSFLKIRNMLMHQAPLFLSVSMC